MQIEGSRRNTDAYETLLRVKGALNGLSKSRSVSMLNGRDRRFVNIAKKTLRDAGGNTHEEKALRTFLFERFPDAKKVVDEIAEERLQALLLTLPRSIVDAFWAKKQNPFTRTMLARIGSIPHAFDPEKDTERDITPAPGHDAVNFKGSRSLCSGSEPYFENAARNNFALLVNQLFFTKCLPHRTGEIVGTPIKNARLSSGQVVLTDMLYLPNTNIRYEHVLETALGKNGEKDTATAARPLRSITDEQAHWVPLRAMRVDRGRGKRAKRAIQERIRITREVA